MSKTQLQPRRHRVGITIVAFLILLLPGEHRIGLGVRYEVHGQDRAKVWIGTHQTLVHGHPAPLFGIGSGGAVDFLNVFFARVGGIGVTRILRPTGDFIVGELILRSKCVRGQGGAAWTATARQAVETNQQRQYSEPSPRGSIPMEISFFTRW